tara:strand:+ start:360 stop:602 length:243 start_codon:yes stop_codon:yes gene_type:complete
MQTAIKLDIEKISYNLRCMTIRAEDLEKDLTNTKEHINKFGMTYENEYSLFKLQMMIERHNLDMKEKRMELAFLYKKSVV